MHPLFPLKDVTVRRVEKTRKVKDPLYCDDLWQISQTEFSMQVPGVGSFYACNGNKVEYAPNSDTDPDWINVYLSGQVLAAVMHQRKIINFHASSFIHRNNGFMILGETGSGKSSLTAAFTLEEALFMSDDFTPVVFNEGVPFIRPVYKAIKIRESTVKQLEIPSSKLTRAEKITGKHHLDVNKAESVNYPLHFIIKIETGGKAGITFTSPSPADSFALLRSEVCSWEMLSGMPETEKAYLQQLVEIIINVRFIKLIRPDGINVRELYREVRKYLADNYGI